MEQEQKNYGVILEKPTPEDWEFGDKTDDDFASQKKVCPGGQWLDVLPDNEWQLGLYFDTKACVTFSFWSAMEILAKKIYNIIINRSDRFTAKMSGTTKSGNSGRKVADSARNDGSPDEARWPFPRQQRTPVFDWDDYYKEIPQEIKDEGEAFLDEWQINYWNVPYTPENFMAALEYSPLQVYVQAWYKKQGTDLYYSPAGYRQNHAVTLVGYKEGEYWLIYDSYDPFVKKLTWDFDFFPWAKKYRLTKLTNDNDMPKFAKNSLKPDATTVYQKGVDEKWHPIANESFFINLYGEWDDHDIPSIEIHPVDIGTTIGEAPWFLRLIQSLFNKV